MFTIWKYESKWIRLLAAIANIPALILLLLLAAGVAIAEGAVAAWEAFCEAARLRIVAQTYARVLTFRGRPT
ncbi:MAG: hypothetical protein DI604_33240 [Delftia acidovorans]|nr:MAG: hypothetical protein DI604_33240 [Delftia acidovorans]